MGMRTVQPIVASVNDSWFNPQYDCLPYFPMLALYYSSLCFFRLKLTVLPEFTPTTWMLRNHRNKATTGEDWEVYAQCVREAMSR